MAATRYVSPAVSPRNGRTMARGSCTSIAPGLRRCRCLAERRSDWWHPEREYATSPVWSHDGKSLAYAQVLTNGGFGSIWIANADGTNPRKIRDAKEPYALSWSPNDDRLAFVQGNLLFVYSAVQFGNIAPAAVWVVDRDGKDARPLTDSLHQSVSPVWSADGDGVFYVSNARGGRDLYYQRVRGTRPDD